MKLILLFSLILASVVAVGQNTTRKGVRAPQPAQTAVSKDTKSALVAPSDAHSVDVNGYDKPLRSRRETFFVTNNEARSLTRMAFTITYFDMNGRQLHEEKHIVNVDIPSGETRQVSFPSWDKQQSFYYRRSAEPKLTEQATPYDVKVAVTGVEYVPKQ